jgi:hypothetical protein
MKTRVGLLVLVMLTSMARAQTGMAATGGDDSGLIPLLAVLIGICFAILVFWGFTQGLAAFFSDSQVRPERRRLLRWIGLNFLEPSLTSGLMVFAFVRVQGATNNFLFLWFTLPLASFLSLLIPLSNRSGFSNRSKAEQFTPEPVTPKPVTPEPVTPEPVTLEQSAYQTLRNVTLARFLSVLLAASGLLVMQLWFTALSGAIGVLVLGWSLQRLTRQVDLLWPIKLEAQTQKQPAP